MHGAECGSYARQSQEKIFTNSGDVKCRPRIRCIQCCSDVTAALCSTQLPIDFKRKGLQGTGAFMPMCCSLAMFRILAPRGLFSRGRLAQDSCEPRDYTELDCVRKTRHANGQHAQAHLATGGLPLRMSLNTVGQTHQELVFRLLPIVCSNLDRRNYGVCSSCAEVSSCSS